MPPHLQFELLRPDEIIAERERCPVIYVPLGPLEWHARHLPFGTDPLNAQAVAREAARQTGGVVFPTLFWGTERERPPEKLRNLGLDEAAYVVGMDFPGISLPSMYAQEEVFAILIRQVLDHLVQSGYALIVLVNGHGGRNHKEVLSRLSVEYSAKTSARVLLTFALPKNSLQIAGHAEAVETSVMLHLYPDLVDLGVLPPLDEPIQIKTGIVDSATFAGQPTADHTLPGESDPRLHASEDRGQMLFKATVAEVTAAVKEQLGSICQPENSR
jgi:creatinine amidohydrolase